MDELTRYSLIALLALSVDWSSCIVMYMYIVYTQNIVNNVVSTTIDIIDYVTGIGNSSREQYIRAGQSVSH